MLWSGGGGGGGGIAAGEKIKKFREKLRGVKKNGGKLHTNDLKTVSFWIINSKICRSKGGGV